MPTVETLSVPATPGGVPEVVAAFGRFARAQDLPRESAWPFLVALDEVLSNIVRHGAPGPAATIDVRFSSGGGLIEIEVVDGGPPFDPLLAPPAETSSPLEQRRPGGLGISLARQLMDTTRYERRGDSNHFFMARRS